MKSKIAEYSLNKIFQLKTCARIHQMMYPLRVCLHRCHAYGVHVCTRAYTDVMHSDTLFYHRSQISVKRDIPSPWMYLCIALAACMWGATLLCALCTMVLDIPHQVLTSITPSQSRVHKLCNLRDLQQIMPFDGVPEELHCLGVVEVCQSSVGLVE